MSDTHIHANVYNYTRTARLTPLTMESQLDLSDPSDLLIYLADTPFACNRVEPLAGGNANFVFRLHLKTPHQGHQTLVLKHAKEYAKFNKDFAFDVRRQVGYR